MSGGFDVNPGQLRDFATKLGGHRATAAEIAGLVAKADVSDKSWGVVGLFVKDKYTEMLADLNDVFQALQDGLQSGADKFNGAAEDYEEQEEAVKQLLNGLQVELDGK
ncbi:WXG100 family type VII secretion target [Actinosynnema sp. NPDC059335]|uniref:WXG100 family type VII secretion target n=1 Tax=Actinosynnema sp. NPDC059335 TaxID=3346804 RepID=UPI00366BAE8C